MPEIKIPPTSSFKERAYLALFIVFLIVGCLIVWNAMDVFLLAFAGLLLAIFFSTLGNFAQRVTHLPYPLALTLVLLLILAIFVLTFWLYAPLISEQSGLLFEQLPVAYHELVRIFSDYVDLSFLSRLDLKKELFTNEKVLTQLTKVFSFTFGTILGFFVFVLIGFYVAYNPQIYFNGFLKAFPQSSRGKVEDVLITTGHSLRWWLLGKVISMIIIGVLTYIGLLLLNVSLAFILGFLAGLLTFIPYIGAILSAVPAILIAFAQSPIKAIYVTLLYIIIHIIDSYFITPFIEQRTVSLPPAFTILMQSLLLILVGFLGLALASPLTVLVLTLFHQFYIKKGRARSHA